jgi:hypothetical protein
MKIRSVVFAGMIAAAALTASPAAAVTASCTTATSLFTGATSTCAGFFEGNLLDNSAADVAAQASALQSLGVNFTSFNDYTKIDLADGATLIDFGTPLLGPTVIGIHFGAGSGFGESTGFFTFNFAQPTQAISFDIKGASGAVLYQTASSAVPEPASWAMMLLGFLGLGAVIRHSRQMRPLPQLG